eukprot:12395286-Ditylum_brightwellii.AAC.1
MQTVTDKHECNSPALLYHLPQHYTGKSESVIRTSQDLLNTLPDKLDKLGFDILKFCNYTTKTLKMLTDAGGTDKHQNSTPKCTCKMAKSHRHGALDFVFRHAVDNWNSTPTKALEYRTLDEVFSGLTS